jgi:hypothetical protein
MYVAQLSQLGPGLRGQALRVTRSCWLLRLTNNMVDTKIAPVAPIIAQSSHSFVCVDLCCSEPKYMMMTKVIMANIINISVQHVAYCF